VAITGSWYTAGLHGLAVVEGETMTKFDIFALVVAVAAAALATGTLLLFAVAEQLRRGRWPWLLDWLARRKWK